MSSIGTNLSSGSGLDVQATVDQLIYVERAPERLMQSQQSLLDSQSTTLKGLQTKLGALEDSVFALKDFAGPLNSQIANSSDSSVLTASANSSAASATHTILVTNLATSSSCYTKPITDAQFTFANDSTLTIQVGTGATTKLTLDGKSLDTAAAYINGFNLGVNASVISDANGARLALVSGTSGSSGKVSITDDNTGLNWSTLSSGQNAHITVDGVPVESTTNTVSGVIPGVTLELSKENGAAPITLTVGADSSAAEQAVNTFVSAYNSVISAINGQFAYDPSTKQSGVLAGDTTLISLQSDLLAEMSYTASSNSSLQTLRSLGVTMNDDGTLAVDNSALSDAVKNNFTDLRNFFQSNSGGVKGFAVRLDATLSEATSVTGPIASDLTGIQNSSKSISDQIDNFEVRISARQQQLTDEYTRIDVMLRQFSATQAQITAQLGALTTTA
jgi:flagellar hook-associated protein 2